MLEYLPNVNDGQPVVTFPAMAALTMPMLFKGQLESNFNFLFNTKIAHCIACYFTLSFSRSLTAFVTSKVDLIYAYHVLILNNVWRLS